jgi:hypothetical protein
VAFSPNYRVADNSFASWAWLDKLGLRLLRRLQNEVSEMMFDLNLWIWLLALVLACSRRTLVLRYELLSTPAAAGIMLEQESSQDEVKF